MLTWKLPHLLPPHDEAPVKALLLFLLALLTWTTSAAAQRLDHTLLHVAAPESFVLTKDGMGMVVALSEAAELVYYNTASESEIKRVELDFKPGPMCLQGKTLFVAGKGSALLYALDLSSGKVREQYEMGGDAIASLACHASEGPVFAATASRAIHSVDPQTDKVLKTDAVGIHLGITPDGKTLLTGFQPRDNEYNYSIGDDLEKIVIPWDGTWGARAQILKYDVKGADLRFAGVQNNAASNGWSFHLSPDGTRVMMPGGGGWRPPEGGAGGGYVTAVFSTKNVESMLGQAPHAQAIAYHPILDLAVTQTGGTRLQLVRGRSMKLLKEWELAKSADGSPRLLAFAARGTKIVFWNGHDPALPLSGLHFFPLDLAAEEREQLTKAYGKLPKPVQLAAASADDDSATGTAEEPTASTATPARTPPKAAARSDSRAMAAGVKTTGRSATTKLRPSRTPNFKPARSPSAGAAAKDPDAASPLREVTAGFNDAKGMNADKKRFSPYAVGAAGQLGGVGEAGWAGPWETGAQLVDSVSFVNDPVQEGDGALYLAPFEGASHSGLRRELADRWTGKFEIEQYVRVPPGGHVFFYIGEEEFKTGPFWGVAEGKFVVVDGTGQQWASSHKMVEHPIACDPDKWHKVTLQIDTDTQKFEFFVDDQKLVPGPLGFRGQAAAIKEYRLLTEKPGGFLLDAITIRPGHTAIEAPEK